MNLALFGGSFDPVHNGHLFLAEEAIKTCSLDRVVFIPCFQSPHKDGVPSAPADDRLAMLKLATADLENVEVDDWELRRKMPSYSWQTAEHYQETFPDAKLFWILGADQWEVIEKWSRPDLLAGLLHFIVFPRDGSDSPKTRDGFHSTILTVTNPCSATAIRHAIAEGILPPENCLNPRVADYIADRQLYAVV